MKIYDVIKELLENNTKIFEIINYNWVALEFSKQVPHPYIIMYGDKICYRDTYETVRLGFAILNYCEFKEYKTIK